MKTRTALAAAAVGGVLTLAACGSASAPGALPKTPATMHSSTSSAPSTPTATPSTVSQATVGANERAFADGLATGLIPADVIAGPLMHAYRTVQYGLWQGDAAMGTDDGPVTVHPVTGGYQLCWPPAGNPSTVCHLFTHFVTNSAGRITAVQIDGESLAGSLAVGPSSRMSGLVTTDIAAYQSVLKDRVYVTFKVRDLSYKPINSNPAALATFNGASSEDDTYSAVPDYLIPGQSVYGYAVFTGHMPVSGVFNLHSNDGYNLTLASSTLHRVGGAP